MKSKLTKIWGVILVLTLLSSLFVMAAPVSAGNLAYTALTGPGATSNFVYGSDVSLFAMAPDGKTFFAYNDNRATYALAVAVIPGATSVIVTTATVAGFIRPSSGNVSYLGLYNAAGTTADGGITYTTITLNTPLAGQSTISGIPLSGSGSIQNAYAVGDSCTQGLLYKSTNSGKSWSASSLGLGFNGLRATAMAVSPSYATDTQLVITSARKVFRSINAGASFGEVGSNVNGPTGVSLLTPPATITSVDIAPYYQGGDAILIGHGDVATLTGVGGVALFTTTSLAWTNISRPTTLIPPAINDGWPLAVGQGADVLAVAFSPNHQSDAEMLALAVTTTVAGATGTTNLWTKFGSTVWSSTVVPAALGNPALVPADPLCNRPLWGTMEFPSDYDWSGNNKILVGLGRGVTPANNDLYVATSGPTGGTSKFTDLNVNGYGTATEVRSVAIKGAYVGAKVMVGQWASNIIYRTTDPSASSPSWLSTTKNPTGGVLAADYTLVAYSPISDDCYAATTGLSSAFNKSTDGGIDYNFISLVDVSQAYSPLTSLAHISMVDFAAVDANTMFLIMYDDALGDGLQNAGDYNMLFKSTDAGSSWEGVLAMRMTGTTDRMAFLGLSSTYATDSTVFVAQRDSRLWKSANGGTSFIGLTSPSTEITAFYVVDANTYYLGGIGGATTTGFYKSGRWTSPSLTSRVNSIALTPDKATIYIGAINGSVYKSSDDGKSFAPVGSPDMGSGNRVYVAVDPDGTTIYAGSDGAGTLASAGLYRWTSTSSQWIPAIDTGSATAATTGTTTIADAITATFSVAGDVLTITNTFGSTISVVNTIGAAALAYNPATFTWTITSALAGNQVMITNIGTMAASGVAVGPIANLGTITFAESAAAGMDPNNNITTPAVIPIGGGTGTYALPDYVGGTYSTSTAGALLCTGVAMSKDGTIYAASATANAGIRRSLSPKSTTADLRNFESIIGSLPAGSWFGNNTVTTSVTPPPMFTNLELVTSTGSNKLYAIAHGGAAGSTAYSDRVLAFEDTLAVATSLSAPADVSVTNGTSVTLNWKKIESPVVLTYRVQTSTDADFANLKNDTLTTGTSITFDGFVPGTNYWWRVRVDTGNPLASKYSAKWTFMPQLGMVSSSGQVSGPDLQSPVYGTDTVIRRPTFSWLLVPGADSYELQLATNPFFAMPTVKAPLSHTTWTWDEDLTYGTTYYWRVRAIKAGNISSPWSESLFTIMLQPTPATPAVVVTQAAPAVVPTIILPTPVVNIPAAAPAAPSPVTPTVIWAIIIIGGILVIAVIVLIVRTRRVP